MWLNLLPYLSFCYVFYIKKKNFYFITQITQQIYVAENWVNDARNEARAAFDARSKVEVELGALKEKQSKLAE